jgi:gamma-glutamylcyclotransferase
MKYFAYGSNMNMEQMQFRCPSAIYLNTVSLSNYKFIINNRGVATVIPKKSSKVYGVLWEITDEDEKNLDNYEGLQFGTYYKEILEIQTPQEKSLSALLYIANDAIRGYPMKNYMELIVNSAINYRLPEFYIRELKSWLQIDKEIL